MESFCAVGKLDIGETVSARAEVYYTQYGWFDRDSDSIYEFELDKDLMKKLMFTPIATGDYNYFLLL